MKNKKLLVALIAFVAAVALMAGIWVTTRPEAPAEPTVPTTSTGTTNPTEAMLKFTVVVVHADGTEKTFSYETTGGNLGSVLVEKGLVVESDSPGLYNIVDGETADWAVNQSFWNFYVDDALVNYGMNDATITDGTVYKLVYTRL